MALADTRLDEMRESQERSTETEISELEGGAVLRKKEGLCSLEGPWAGDKNNPLGSKKIKAR